MQLFWQLPGPARFLARIGQSFREGRNVVIALPDHGPEYIRYAIAELVAREDLYAWHPINASDAETDGASPAELIARQCVPGGRPCTVKELAEDEYFRGMVMWVDGIPREQWSMWRDFIEAYSHLCRARLAHERALFCFPVSGSLTRELPPEDVTCAVHPWRGIISRIDMLLLFSQLLADRTLSRLHADIWIAVGTELAGTDASLAARLASADLELVLQPKSLLEQFARNRGWVRASVGEAPAWSLGNEDLLDGRSIVHSARIILDDGGEEEIERRIWRGQVGVLFPFLEEQRIEMLRRLKRFLTVPHETPFGTITDVRDFELSHILHHSRRNPVDESTKSRIERLADMRHRLAHLEAVPFSLLASI